MSGRTADSHRTERGSIVIASSVVMMLVLIGGAMVLRTQIGVDAVAVESDTVLADAFADRGVAEVLARIDAGERGAFSRSVDTSLGSYRYEVDPLEDGTFLARSEGWVDGVARAVEVRIGGSDEPYTLAVNTSAVISNTSGTIAGRVVTNGSISASGTRVGDTVDLYGRAATCTGCASGNRFPDLLDLPYPTSPTGSIQRCPSGGRFSGIIDGQNGVPVVCTSGDVGSPSVLFTGTVEVVNPPLVVHVQIGLDIEIANARINADGRAEDFQLVGEGDDDYWWFDTTNSTVNGIVYAPGRDARMSSTRLTGQLAVGVLSISTTGDSTNDVWIAPSPSLLESQPSGWVVTSFERVPSR